MLKRGAGERFVRTRILRKQYTVQDRTQDNRAIRNVIPPGTSRPVGEPVQEANSERSVEIDWFSARFPMTIQQLSPSICLAVQAIIEAAEQRVAGEKAARQEGSAYWPIGYASPRRGGLSWHGYADEIALK
ncbi:hypothetical protein E4U19_007477 [Claviceps sp. Clav32 group G5]|nr:hypothetical protein E4U19_007477 [Claviceps sp. Clav32 group G5]KAG6043216.1 hypothetical protein E4U39_004800 [Claviceps sp. Clav50 group G5]